MQAKPYPEAKRRILVERNTRDFIKFLVEIRYEEGKQFIREKLLRSHVPGFRPGRTPLSLTVSRLIVKLKNKQELTKADSDIWNSFTNVWMYWVKSHPELDDILTAFDNKADFDENHECITPPNSELDIECFKLLLEASHNALIHQEMVERFYEYGYFNEDERIQNLVNQVPPCEEIERREHLAVLPDRVDELFQAIDGLSRSIEDLDSRVSAAESANGLEQKLTQLITKERQYFDTELQKLEQKTVEDHKSFDARLSNTESTSTQLVGLVRRISSLESRFSELNESINSFTDKLPEIESVNRQKISQLVDQRVRDRIKQLNSQVPGRIESLERRLNETEVAISKIQSEMTDGPKIATQALKTGEQYKAQLKGKTEHYKDENDYLEDFRHCLQRFGVIDSEDEEIAPAIHVALKAFPAVEIADARVIKVWRLMCDDHFNLTTVNVEMGWLGLQDWFPDLFARECFKEKLEQGDLEVSIRRMLELGDMPWVIYLRDCDRSFPDSYLPRFLDWIDELCEGSIKVFLIRSFGTNRCETDEDFYARVARLPKPKIQEPIESRNLRPSGIPLTLSEWDSWCQPDPDSNSQYEIYYDSLDRIKSGVENRGMQIPIVLLREIQRYLRLSHDIMAKTRALDWALTLRLLPWIGNRHRLIDAVQNIVNENNQELSHFQEGLQMAREADV